MVKYKVGDLLEAADRGEIQVIAHQCNCFNVGRRGIAPLIFEKYPNAKLADQQTEKGSKDKLGRLTFGFGDNMTWVFNLYGQYHWSYHEKEYGTQYPALRSALQKMKFLLDRRWGMFYHEKPKIGFPLIGCGLAGGKWEEVAPMIEDIFHDWDVTIYTLLPMKGIDYESQSSSE